jgi:pimeloyl-ACP methyl ester carboxylesterase
MPRAAGHHPRVVDPQGSAAGRVMKPAEREGGTPNDRAMAAFGLLHRSMRALARRFAGNYGNVRGCQPVGIEPFSVELGPITLSGLQCPGPKPPLVVLHGLNNNAWSWARVASLMRGRRWILAVSARGHGNSSRPATGYTLADTTSDLKQLLDKMTDGPVDLAGHSWGGKVACHFAATHPQRVRSLMLADAVPPAGLGVVLRAVPSLIRLSMIPERGPFSSRRVWERAGKSIPYLATWDEIDQRLWADCFWEREDGSYHPRLSDSALEQIVKEAVNADITGLLGQIQCPVLRLQPTWSVSLLKSEWEPLRRAAPRYLQQHISGDHTFIHTNPIDTAGAMQAFLKQVDG